MSESKERFVSKLWYQWGSVRPDLKARDIARALESKGYISITSGSLNDDLRARYRETQKMRDIPKTEFKAVITKVLQDYSPEE